MGSERIGLALKLWFNDVFALARADLAASTLKRKRRDLERRIDSILLQTTDCDETRGVLRKIANARDQLLIRACGNRFPYEKAPSLQAGRCLSAVESDFRLG